MVVAIGRTRACGVVVVSGGGSYGPYQVATRSRSGVAIPTGASKNTCAAGWHGQHDGLRSCHATRRLTAGSPYGPYGPPPLTTTTQPELVWPMATTNQPYNHPLPIWWSLILIWRPTTTQRRTLIWPLAGRRARCARRNDACNKTDSFYTHQNLSSALLHGPGRLNGLRL